VVRAGPGWLANASSGSLIEAAPWTTMQNPARSGHSKLLVPESTGSKAALGAAQIELLPRCAGAVEFVAGA
jgi:hypothetical protein